MLHNKIIFNIFTRDIVINMISAGFLTCSPFRRRLPNFKKSQWQCGNAEV